MNNITAKEYPLSKIFCKDFDYFIPAYQRPYSWEEGHTETLMDNLYDSYTQRRDEQYFLGSIVLMKEDNSPKADVIDGQQRLTTLTIIFSCLSKFLSDDARASCQKYVREPGDSIEGLKPAPRLHLRKKDEDFFEKYIQNFNLDELLAADSERFDTEAQAHIQTNCAIIIKKIKVYFNEDKEKVRDFCSFMAKNCCLVVVSTAGQDSAWRIFSVMNSTGLDLSPTDIFKSELINSIEESEQLDYTDKWEELEIATTRQGFSDLFSHIRMIFIKAKAKDSLLTEMRELVLNQYSSKSKEFIDQVLEPYAKAYQWLKSSTFKSTNYEKEINKLLKWLNRIDNSDWLPCAIKFVADNGDDNEYLYWFIGKLERLAAYLYVTAQDVNGRIERYAQVLAEMEKSHDINNKLKSIELSDDEKKQFIEKLNGKIYKYSPKRRNYILLRIDSFIAVDDVDYEVKTLTVEHVLPQNPNPNSKWMIDWASETDREEWVHCLGNLLLLDRRKNSEAQNYDFAEKKSKYFTGKNGVSKFALTTQVLNETTWDKSVVERRQKLLVEKAMDEWELNV